MPMSHLQPKKNYGIFNTLHFLRNYSEPQNSVDRDFGEKKKEEHKNSIGISAHKFSLKKTN